MAGRGMTMLAHASACGEDEVAYGERRRILVVDDSDEMREALAVYLGGDHEVQTAANGREAMLTVLRDGFDLVLCDLQMPVMEGDVFIRELRAMGDPTPVVLMSGDPSAPEVARALRVPFLRKPFDVRQLRQRIDDVLNPGKHHA